MDNNGDTGKTALRAQAWRGWFEGWLTLPLEQRSIGFYALPEEYFASTADHIASTLGLDPEADVVLDLGCDSAMVTRVVGPRCRRLVGADFIPGLVADVPRGSVRSATGRDAAFVAADGRFLPFRSQAFTKAYCAGVIHTLPSREDGVAMIEELVRVCRPGGAVLVAAVPDRAKRFQSFVDLWRHAGPIGKMRRLLSPMIPGWAKRAARRLLGLPPGLVFLQYDLRELKRAFEARGLTCDVLDFPATYWSLHFRRTRANLLIRIPEGRPSAARAGEPAAMAGRDLARGGAVPARSA